MGLVNGVGDFISSAAVGLLWTIFGSAAGFGYAAVLTVGGSLVLLKVPNSRCRG